MDYLTLRLKVDLNALHRFVIARVESEGEEVHERLVLALENIRDMLIGVGNQLEGPPIAQVIDI